MLEIHLSNVLVTSHSCLCLVLEIFLTGSVYFQFIHLILSVGSMCARIQNKMFCQDATGPLVGTFFSFSGFVILTKVEMEFHVSKCWFGVKC